MAKSALVFRRVELKFRTTESVVQEVLSLLMPHLRPDEYKQSTIANLYLDTPSHRLIAASMEAKGYKEKLRLRAYGVPQEDSPTFLEIKRKYKGVVYKRRVILPHKEAMAYLTDGTPLPDSQIAREIDYAMAHYPGIQPMMAIFYEREAYYDKDDPTLRVTIDRNIRYRTEDLDLSHGTDGVRIIAPDEVLLEVKADVLPRYIIDVLNQYKLYHSGFSKYATAYRMVRGVLPHPEQVKGENTYV